MLVSELQRCWCVFHFRQSQADYLPLLPVFMLSYNVLIQHLTQHDNDINPLLSFSESKCIFQNTESPV